MHFIKNNQKNETFILRHLSTIEHGCSSQWQAYSQYLEGGCSGAYLDSIDNFVMCFHKTKGQIMYNKI